MAQHSLYPPIEPHDSGMLSLDGPHEMYWEVCGAPAGTPVVFLHGGPGAGCSPTHRRFFDPRRFRVILFDQRGAGRSVPHASVENNTTWRLIDDIERLREHAGVERWLLFGGSWGSTLALAYAQAHPDRCLGMILRGVFLGTRAEIAWFVEGMGRFYPEVAEAFLDGAPADGRDALLASYHRRLLDPDPDIHMPAARLWAGFEISCSTIRHSGRLVGYGSDKGALSLARLECHYMVNRMFLEEGQLLANADLIGDMPVAIVQGRYDVICPPRTAHTLAAALQNADLRIVEDAGHAALEPGIRAALVAAADGFAP